MTQVLTFHWGNVLKFHTGEYISQHTVFLTLKLLFYFLIQYGTLDVVSFGWNSSSKNAALIPRIFFPMSFSPTSSDCSMWKLMAWNWTFSIFGFRLILLFLVNNCFKNQTILYFIWFWKKGYLYLASVNIFTVHYKSKLWN